MRASTDCALQLTNSACGGLLIIDFICLIKGDSVKDKYWKLQVFWDVWAIQLEK